MQAGNSAPPLNTPWLLAVLVGSDLSKSAVRCATLPFWLIVGSIIPVALAIAVAEGQKLVRPGSSSSQHVGCRLQAASGLLAAGFPAAVFTSALHRCLCC